MCMLAFVLPFLRTVVSCISLHSRTHDGCQRVRARKARTVTRGVVMRALQSLLVSATLVASIGALTGCGGVSDLTKENVNRSETAVLQAQRAIGSSEYG